MRQALLVEHRLHRNGGLDLGVKAPGIHRHARQQVFGQRLHPIGHLAFAAQKRGQAVDADGAEKLRVGQPDAHRPGSPARDPADRPALASCADIEFSSPPTGSPRW